MQLRFLLLAFAAVMITASVNAQTAKGSQFIDASTLTMIGKAFPTPSPYHRLDTSAVKGMSPSENQQSRCSAGLAVIFSTNSTYIDLLPVYKWKHKKENITGIAATGFDLYIKQRDKWVYAGTTAPSSENTAVRIVSAMDTTEKECLLYLPLYSELEHLEIGVEKSASIKAVPNPFTYKMVIFGSSFTQGTSASRPAMSYPAQIERDLDINVCNLGFAGNSKLQPYFAEMIANVEADAIVFDAFSNPTDTMITERLAAFVEIIARKHKNTPLIFLHTLYRGNANFNLRSRDNEARKRKAAMNIMAGILRKYPNVYLLENPLSKEVSDDMSADGVHPSDLGYQFVAKNISIQLNTILKIRKNKSNGHQ